jgi:hypothetical protein
VTPLALAQNSTTLRIALMLPTTMGGLMTSLDLSTIMQPDEAEQIGVETLSPEQRQALAEWGLRLFSLGQSIVSHIDAVKYGGRLIVLEDGSKWAVDELDDMTADMWGPGGRVVVIDGEMFLLDESEKVAVQPED